MGRRSTGAWTINDGRQIQISQLIKADVVRWGHSTTANWGWKVDGVVKSDIWINAIYNDSEQYVRFIYNITRNGEQIKMDYKIGLLERPSNLGIGKVLFFICPVSQKPCRKLYIAYDSTFFKCREAYRNRIYYPMQLAGKLGMNNDRYWKLEQQIKELEKGRTTYSYAGKITRRAARLQMLNEKQEIAGWLKWMPESYPCGLRRSMLRFLAELENADKNRGNL